MACKELEEFLAASQGQLGDPQVAAQKNEIFARAVQEDSEKAQEILLKSVQTNTQGKRQRTRTNLQTQEKEEEISVEEETAPPPGGKKGNKGKLTEHSKKLDTVVRVQQFHGNIIAKITSIEALDIILIRQREVQIKSYFDRLGPLIKQLDGNDKVVNTWTSNAMYVVRCKSSAARQSVSEYLKAEVNKLGMGIRVVLSTPSDRQILQQPLTKVLSTLRELGPSVPQGAQAPR